MSEPHDISDFNDLHCALGLAAVKAAVEAAVYPEAQETAEPGEADPGAGGDAPVSELQREQAGRAEFEQLIAASDDWDHLVYHVAAAVRCSALREPSRQYLLKKIATKTKVPIRLLQNKQDERRAKKGEHEDPAEFMAELNARHAVVPSGGRVMILNEEFDMELGRKVVTFSARADLVLLYENRVTWRDGEALDIGTYWLRNPQRRQYEGIAFAPGRDTGRYYNTWQGWGVEAAETGSCERYKAFIQEVICAGDAEAYAYVWRWLAHLFQRPWEVPETALVLRSVPGAGKNTFVAPLAKLIGAHYLELSHVDQLVGRFSGHMADKLLVFANEALWGGDKSSEGTFKALVTDKEGQVEAKHRDMTSRANFKRVIIASNEDWAAPKGARDRRLVTLDVVPSWVGDRSYFEAVRAELRKGGLRRLLHELLTTPLDGFRTQEIPQQLREAGWDMAVASMDTVQAWWLSVLAQGYLWENETLEGTFGEWPVLVQSRVLHAVYLKWCEKQRKFHPVDPVVFGRKMHKLGLETKRGEWVTTSNGKKQRVPQYKLPTLQAARELLAEEYVLPEAMWGNQE